MAAPSRQSRPSSQQNSGAPDPLERKACVLLDFLHNEEGSSLSNARQDNEFVSMKSVEIRHVTDPYLQKVVKVAGDEVAVQDLLEHVYRLFEGSEAFSRRTIEDDAHNDQRAESDGTWCDLSAHSHDVPFVEQALRAAMARCRADIHTDCQARICEPPVGSVDHQKAPAGAVRPQLRAARSRPTRARAGRPRWRYRAHPGEPPDCRQAVGRAAVPSQVAARSSNARECPARCRQHSLHGLRRRAA